MSDQEGSAEKYALAIVGLLVTGVVAVVVGFGVARSRPHAPPAPPAAETAVAAVERILFDVGQDALPANANDVLERVSTAARARVGTVVLVSGYHDASGNLAANLDLARRRAEQVRHALEANGVSPSQVVLNKPVQTTGSGDPAEARRVEMRVE